MLHNLYLLQALLLSIRHNIPWSLDPSHCVIFFAADLFQVIAYWIIYTCCRHCCHAAHATCHEVLIPAVVHFLHCWLISGVGAHLHKRIWGCVWCRRSQLRVDLYTRTRLTGAQGHTPLIHDSGVTVVRKDGTSRPVLGKLRGVLVNTPATWWSVCQFHFFITIFVVVWISWDTGLTLSYWRDFTFERKKNASMLQKIFYWQRWKIHSVN